MPRRTIAQRWEETRIAKERAEVEAAQAARAQASTPREGRKSISQKWEEARIAKEKAEAETSQVGAATRATKGAVLLKQWEEAKIAREMAEAQAAAVAVAVRKSVLEKEPKGEKVLVSFEEARLAREQAAAAAAEAAAADKIAMAAQQREHGESVVQKWTVALSAKEQADAEAAAAEAAEKAARAAEAGGILGMERAAAEQEASLKVQREQVAAAQVAALRRKASIKRWTDEAEEVDEQPGSARRVAQLGRSFGLYTGTGNEGPMLKLNAPGIFAVQAGQQLAETCRKQRGMYTKAGKAILALPFAFESDVLDDFDRETTTAYVLALPWGEMGPLIDKLTPGGRKITFASVREECVSTTQLAQIHRATRHTGELVALKVHRPSVHHAFDHDLGSFLKLVGQFDTFTGWSISWFAEWTVDQLRKELDFRYEADAHEACNQCVQEHRSHFRGLLAVPMLHTELCNRRLLVMEYIEGCTLTDVRDWFRGFDDERHGPVVRDALEAFHALQVLIDGRFHGDPHARNLMVRQRTPANVQPGDAPLEECPYEVVVIDHGDCHELDRDTRLQVNLTVRIDTVEAGPLIYSCGIYYRK